MCCYIFNTATTTHKLVRAKELSLILRCACASLDPSHNSIRSAAQYVAALNCTTLNRSRARTARMRARVYASSVNMWTIIIDQSRARTAQNRRHAHQHLVEQQPVNACLLVCGVECTHMYTRCASMPRHRVLHTSTHTSSLTNPRTRARSTSSNSSRPQSESRARWGTAKRSRAQQNSISIINIPVCGCCVLAPRIRGFRVSSLPAGFVYKHVHDVSHDARLKNDEANVSVRRSTSLSHTEMRDARELLIRLCSKLHKMCVRAEAYTHKTTTTTTHNN